MMRTTGYSLSITAQLQARGEVGPPGVHTPDECMPADAVHRRAGASAACEIRRGVDALDRRTEGIGGTGSV